MNRRRKTLACVSLLAVLIVGMFFPAERAVCEQQEQAEPPDFLYAQSAVLMDADSGRILYGKNGQQERAMASTTKIMTCILALELGNPESEVSISREAASQPKVHLGMREGQVFRLEDLLYSLMLESHNDSAVAIAEHIGGSVEGFADIMNRKASELGCGNTYFITPNGLDAEDGKGIHHTTAEDLARIMRYCIMTSDKRDEFLEITGCQSHSFSDKSGKNSYSCNNHNAFLHMMKGALSGKTGFTGDAGYCYVGALRDGERTFIVALLACGWPNNKGYKWTDTRKLMTYGLSNYEYRDAGEEKSRFSVIVENGGDAEHPSEAQVQTSACADTERISVLLGADEKVEVETELPESVQAPVEAGDRLGQVRYILDGKCIRQYDIVATETVEERDYLFCLRYVLSRLTG